MHVFSFDVCVSTNDLVKIGRLCDAHMVIDVAADDDTDASFVTASLTACLMAGIHGMPTACLVRI